MFTLQLLRSKLQNGGFIGFLLLTNDFAAVVIWDYYLIVLSLTPEICCFTAVHLDNFIFTAVHPQ